MGGKSAAPPDYSAMAAATERGIATAEKLGNRSMDFAQRQYEEMKPLAQRVYEQQMAAQQQQMTQAQDYYDYAKSTFRPVEQGLVTDAEKFNTKDYQEGLARDAAAAAGRAFTTTQAANQRAMASMGINPNSGKALTLNAQSNLGLAAQRANIMTNTRTQAENMGWARRMDVTGLGRGLAGASLGAYQGATGAGSAGLTSAMAPGNQYTGAFGQGAGYMMGGAQMGLQGAGNILNAQTSAYNTAAQTDPMNTMLGAAAGVGAAYGLKKFI